MLGTAQSRQEHTLVASMTTTGMGPSLAIEGSTDAVVFETYVKQFLAPDLQPGQVSWSWTTWVLTKVSV